MLNQMPIYNKLKILIANKENTESRKLSYRTVAQEAGIPLSVLTEYTGQRVKRFDINTLEKLCRYFSVQPGDLLGFIDNPPPSAPPAKKPKAHK
jgi:DNA-binding Xre family transcriptional regulator